MKKRQLCLAALCTVTMFLMSISISSATANSTNPTKENSFYEERGYPNAPNLVTCPPSGLFFTSCIVTGLAAPTTDCTLNAPLSWTLITFPAMPTGTTPTDPNGNYQPGMYELEWTVDDCDGIVTCTVLFTIFDQTSPVFTCPLFQFVDCPSDIPTPFTSVADFIAGGGLASDDCSETSNLIFVSSVDVPTPDPNDCPGSIVRTYNFTDEAGNPGGCIQNIIVQDNIFPTFTVPADITIFTDPNPTNNCFFDAGINITGDVTDEMENCIGSLGEAVFTDVDNINGCTPGSGSNVHGTITRTWILTDGCNNTTTQVQTITIVDNTAPSFTAPGDVTIFTDPDPLQGCAYDSDPANTGDVTNELDNCSTNLEATFVDVVMENTPCEGSSVITRTWMLVDDCGNAAPNQVQTITVTDDSDPSFTVPADITIYVNASCNWDASPMMTGQPTNVIDNCDMTLFPIFVDLIDGGNCPGERVITRTWTLEDDCMNSVSAQQIITVEDTISPTFTAPVNTEIFMSAACTYDADISITGDVTDEMDNCTFGATWQATFVDDLSGLTLCNGTGVIARTWSLVDSCDNAAADQIQMITVTDNIPPTFTAPADTIVYADMTCMIDTTTANIGDVMDEMDNCSSALEATYVDDVSGLTLCNGTGTILRTWSLMDDCGVMAADQIQTITIADTLDPTFTVPLDATIYSDANCAYDASVSETGDVTDEMDNCSMGIEATFTDVVGPGNCPGDSVLIRTWVLLDDCGNAAPIQTQTISILDTIAPVVTCSDLTFSNDSGVCEATVTIPAPVVDEGCTTVTIVNDYNGTDNASDTYPVGVTTVVWTVTDECDNTGTCSFTVTVNDVEDPIIVGDNNLQVAIGGAGVAQLMTTDIVLMATDNCELDTVWIRRLEPNGGPCNIIDNDVFGDTVNFCCADVGNIIAVEVEAIDIYGNNALIMVMIPVVDNIAPMTTCPSDVTINCEFQLDLNDMSNLGIIVEDPATPNPIIVNGLTVGFDGVASDNCSPLVITETFDDSDIECNQGTIVRTFTVTDIAGNTTTCSQNITIMDDDPFDFDDITFPANFEFFDCNNVDTDPSITGEPTFLQDKCSIIGFSHSDVPFQNPNSGCPHFIRTWTVIDWCQYQSNTPGSPGIWEMDQTISVINSVAPTFDACQDTIVCADEITCNGELFFTMTAEDDCTATADLQWTYSLDLFGEGNTFINGNVNTIFGTFPQGDHIVTWTVEDRCGNANTCVQNMTIKDCKAPTVVCINGLAIGLQPLNGGGASVEIWASDFNQGSFDNCTATSDLIYSFSSDPTDQFVEYTCADVGQQNIEIWATDEKGNQSNCNTYVLVQDNNGVCPPGGMVRVGGNMFSEIGEGIENVAVYIDSDNMSDMNMSTDNGEYHFDHVEMYDNYEVEPVLNVEHMNGVSTLDLVLIQKHLLGLETLESPYKLIAADINNTGSLSAIDLVELRKLILGVFSEFPNNMSWRFIPETLVFPDPTYPWNFEELIEIQNIDQDEMGLNFIGVKIGDVNNTAIANDFTSTSESRSGDQVTFVIDDVSFTKGDKVSIPMTASDFNDIVGMQFTLDYNEQILQYERVVPAALSINQSNVAIPKIDKDVITLSWHNVVPQSSDEILFYLEFTALADGSIHNYFDITSDMTEAIAFDQDYQSIEVVSRFEEKIERVAVYQNNPNPFTHQTAISIVLPADDQVQVHVFDNKGTMVYHHNSLMNAGTNQVFITRDDLRNQSGIYYYEVSTSAERITKRMVLLK